MARTGQTPFVRTLRQFPARAVVDGTVAAEGTYNICADLFTKLYPTLPSPEIMVRRVAADGTFVEVGLTNNQEVDRGYCASQERTLDLQLSCKDGLALFPDLIAGCKDMLACLP